MNIATEFKDVYDLIDNQEVGDKLVLSFIQDRTLDNEYPVELGFTVVKNQENTKVIHSQHLNSTYKAIRLDGRNKQTYLLREKSQQRIDTVFAYPFPTEYSLGAKVTDLLGGSDSKTLVVFGSCGRRIAYAGVEKGEEVVIKCKDKTIPIEVTYESGNWSPNILDTSDIVSASVMFNKPLDEEYYGVNSLIRNMEFCSEPEDVSIEKRF